MYHLYKLYSLLFYFGAVIPSHSIVFINTTDAKNDNDSLIEARNKRQFFTPDSLKPEVYLEACKTCDSVEMYSMLSPVRPESHYHST